MSMWLWLLGAALAQSPEPPEERAWGPAADAQEVPDAPQLSLRPVPDYDGREDAPPSLGKSLLWVPRAVLFPVDAVGKYVVYPPVRAVARTVERDGIAKKIERALTIGDPDGAHALLLPTAFFDFGFRQSIGLVLIGSDIGPQGRNSFRLGTAFGGPNWLALHGSWEHDFGSQVEDSSSYAFWEAAYLKRPDEVFAGIVSFDPDDATRYTRIRLGARAGADLYGGLYDHVRVSAGIQRNEFDTNDDEVWDDDPIDEEYDTSLISGFDEGYTLVDLTVAGIADSRVRRPAPGSGAAADFELTLGTDITGATTPFLRASGGLSAYWDITGTNRTLMLRQWASSVQALGDQPVAFTELVTIGGIERHRGFLRQSWRGGSAVLTTLEYTWPVWVMFDASLYAEAGGVYEPWLKNYDIGASRASFGMGFTAKDREVPLRAQFGIGTSRFDDDTFEIDSFRFSLGTTGIQ